MKRLWKQVAICALLAAAFWGSSVVSDRRTLNNGLIRFHVVANSDRERDQAVKLKVRDAVIAGLQQDLNQISDLNAAKVYLTENLPKIQKIANQTLKEAGFEECAVVTLCKEAFPVRQYETFSLPAGIYEALRITIGEGNGQNWWCVTFPGLCMPATATGFAEEASAAGFSDALCSTLSRDESYKIRFYALDVLGELEKIFFEG